ncbi:MAG: helix-turn-helix transcriptional regulator [Pseudomonadota bacterium]
MAEGAVEFGKLVRERRNAQRLSQEALAAKAFGNLDRKGYISRIENGKIPNITHDVVQQVATALEIDRELIPETLQWPEAARVVADTNTRVQALQTQLQALEDKLVATEADRAREFGIKEGMLIALARRYAEGSPDSFDTALAGLERALEVARDEREKGALASNIDEAVNQIFAKVDALNAEGDLEGGAAVIDDALAALKEEEDRRDALQLTLYDRGIAQAILARDADTVCRFAFAKIDLQRLKNHDEHYQAMRSAFLEWYERGRDKGLNFDLEVAIALIRECRARVSSIDHRGAVLNRLGTALATLGERESGTARLEDAVSAYRLALEEFTRERVPLDWARTQMNLGVVLSYLGAREAGTSRLEEAVTVYQLALQEMTRDRLPLQWAKTQMNLGIVLATLGERDGHKASMEDAISAYRLASEEWSRDNLPFEWATLQMNLGNALAVLGAWESGTESLETAVGAYYLALEEWTRERVPLDWAMTQNNLGNALRILGERESGTAHLEDAVSAYCLALEEWTRKRVPIQWAMTHENLALAEKALAEKDGEDRNAHLSVALAHVNQALEVYSPDESAYHFESATKLRDDIIAAM